MKKFLGFVILIICMVVLTELNTGNLINDVKGFFTTSHANSFDNIYSVDTIPKDHENLLKVKRDTESGNNKQLSFLYTLGYKSGYPISNFIYRNLYYLQVYQLSNTFNLSLKTTIKEFYVSASNWGVSMLNDRSAVSYSYQSIPKNNIAAIDLKLLGKQTQIILKNDSVAYYYSHFMNFSIQYELSGPNIVYGEPKSNNFFFSTFPPLEILLLKKNHNLYLLAMSVNSEAGTANYPSGMLYDLIKNK